MKAISILWRNNLHAFHGEWQTEEHRMMCFTFVFPVTNSSYHWALQKHWNCLTATGKCGKERFQFIVDKRVFSEGFSDYVLWLLVIKMGFTKLHDLNLLKILPFCQRFLDIILGFWRITNMKTYNKELNKINGIRQ